MIFLLRFFVVLLIGGLISFGGTLYCLFNPRNPNNVTRFARLFGWSLTPFFGMKVISRPNPKVKKYGSCIYIANHQNNYDILVAATIVQPRTVTVGKKSLAWIPFFGQLYYLSGNILLDRNNKSKARDTLERVVQEIHNKNISVWMFPEGTRSRGKGLLPFKVGAFRVAIAAGIPIVPICISDIHKTKLNRWHNGSVIVEMLDPIETKNLSKDNGKQLMDNCYTLMQDKIQQLNNEVERLDSSANK